MQPYENAILVPESVSNVSKTKESIIQLSTSTKVLYSLFNFFVPVFTMIGLVGKFEILGIKGILLVILGVVIGLFCLLFNLFKYNYFLKIKDKMLQVCRKTSHQERIIETLLIEEGIPHKLGRNFVLKYNDKKVKLLHPYPSILGALCWIGPCILIPLAHTILLERNKQAELFKYFPQLFEKGPKTPSQTAYMVSTVLMWGLTIFSSLLGIIGLLFAPFYFLGTSA